MSHASRHRLNLFIEPDHAKRLDELAAKKGVSKSSIVAAALASWLSPDAADQREAAMAKRLDRLSRQFEQAGARPEHPDRDAGAVRALLPDRQHAGAGGASGSRAGTGQGALRAVRRTAWPALAARAQPGARGARGDPARARSGWTRRRHWPKRRNVRGKLPYECHSATTIVRCHFAGSAHAHAAHGHGTADRRRARRPGRGGGDAEPRRHAVGRPPLHGPRCHRASRCPPRTANASSAWSRRMSAQRCIAAGPCCPPSCRRPASASRASCRQRRQAPAFALRKRAVGVIRPGRLRASTAF